jgi:outer membrane protein OmpA-like peptidoglycan-associated protein
MSNQNWCSTLAALSLMFAVGRPARAQDHIAAEALEPAPMTQGSVLSVYGARALPAKGFSLTLLGSYGRKPLTLERSDTQRQLGSLTGSVGTVSFMGAFGLGSRVDVGVALPLHRMGEASSLGAGVPSSVTTMRVASSTLAMGDLRVVPRVSLLARGRDAGFGLALLAQVYFPTGRDNVYAGESFRVEPRVALDWRNKAGVLLAFNVGYLIRARTTLLDARIDDALRAAVGTELPLFKGLSGMLEIGTQVNVMSANFTRADVPTEGFLGVRYRFSGITAQLGGGPGLVRGLTAPSYRLALALSYTAEPAAVQLPPLEIEESPPVETDQDGDGVSDTQDACPNAAEDNDGHDDADGCPDLDNDADGVADAADSCKNEAEDRDRHEDNDGCPDLDNDGDQIADADDRCPTVAGLASEQGCPAPAAHAAVVVTEKSIELRESVFFEKNRSTIDQRSAPLLDQIASALQAHTEIQSVVIEGHTDDRGSKKKNIELSQQRAAAVRAALVERGVAADRLRAQGLGPERPVVDNQTEENRAKNRRVELRIERRAP